MGDVGESEAEALEALLVLAFLEEPGTDTPGAATARPNVPPEGGEEAPTGQGEGVNVPERRWAGLRRAA